jgi:hypothetical protein
MQLCIRAIGAAREAPEPQRPLSPHLRMQPFALGDTRESLGTGPGGDRHTTVLWQFSATKLIALALSSVNQPARVGLGGSSAQWRQPPSAMQTWSR